MNSMNSRGLHSFPFNLSRIKFLVVDGIGLFLLSQFSSSLPYLSYRLMRPLSKIETHRGGSIPSWPFVSLPLSCVYAVLSFLPLFGIFSTGRSPRSSGVAVPLPFLVCLFYSKFYFALLICHTGANKMIILIIKTYR